MYDRLLFPAGELVDSPAIFLLIYYSTEKVVTFIRFFVFSLSGSPITIPYSPGCKFSNTIK